MTMMHLNLLGMKICVKCKENEARPPTASRPSGYSYCRKCFTLEQSKYKERNPEKVKRSNAESYVKNKESRLLKATTYRKENRQKIKESAALSRIQKREIIEKVKDHPCLDCGGRFPSECMDFDHVRGVKRFNIANIGGSSMSVDVLFEEMAKCEIVCANCHRIRTKKRSKGLPISSI